VYNTLYGLVYMLMQAVYTLNPMETTSMGNRITLLREARGLTVAGLAAEIGVTRALVWQWEQDMVKGIRPENFIRLCHVLGVQPEYLIWGADKTPKDPTGRFRTLPRP